MPQDYVYVNTQHPTKEGEILPGNDNARIQADDHANRPSRMRITPKHETPIQLTLRNLRLHMNKSPERFHGRSRDVTGDEEVFDNTVPPAPKDDYAS